MKEKIGIEKLIALLNEYDSGWDYDDYYGPYQYGQDTDAYKYGKYYLVSRDYGFIKWLVENDKINRWRVENNQDYAEYLGNLPLEEYGTEVLLMLLSIADEPIDYLCNLLFKFE